MTHNNIRADNVTDNAVEIDEFHSSSFDEDDGLITAFNDPGILDEFVGDVGNFTLTNTPGYELYPEHSLFAHTTVGTIIGDTERFRTDFDYEYGCMFQFTISNEGDRYRGSWLFGVQDPQDPRFSGIEIEFRWDEIQIKEAQQETRTSIRNIPIEAGTTYEPIIGFPGENDVSFELYTADGTEVYSTTHTCNNRDEYDGGMMGFRIGRVGSPLYFDRIWKRQP